MSKVGGMLLCAFPLLFLGAATLAADEWDVATITDDAASTTHNELIHGTSQTHDLATHGVADQDWYLIGSKQYTSWTVIVDGTTGDLGWNFDLSRYDQAGTTLLQTYYSTTGPLAYSKYLAWENTSSAEAIHSIVVTGADCDPACDANDRYHIRSYETTLAIPRYNNSGGQVTVLVCQHIAASPLTSAHAYLWTAAGATPVTTVSMAFGFHAAQVVNLATVNGGIANNTTGTITVSHSAELGGVVCKAVALEPATGFSFDTPGLTRP